MGRMRGSVLAPAPCVGHGSTFEPVRAGKVVFTSVQGTNRRARSLSPMQVPKDPGGSGANFQQPRLPQPAQVCGGHPVRGFRPAVRPARLWRSGWLRRPDGLRRSADFLRRGDPAHDGRRRGHEDRCLARGDPARGCHHGDLGAGAGGRGVDGGHHRCHDRRSARRSRAVPDHHLQAGGQRADDAGVRRGRGRFPRGAHRRVRAGVSGHRVAGDPR